MESTIAAITEEKALRNLLDVAQNVEDWTNPKELKELELHVRGEKAFGRKGDNLLHVLIMGENPGLDMGRKARRDPNNPRQERNNSLWLDALPESGSASTPSTVPGANQSSAPSATAMPSSNKNTTPNYDRAKPGGKSTAGGRTTIDKGTDAGGRTTIDKGTDGGGRTTKDKGTDAGIGRNLLIWMLRHRTYREYFKNLPSARDGRSAEQEKLPVHLAFMRKNLGFLACFLGLFYDHKTKRMLSLLHKILETEDPKTKENCVHLAIHQSIQFASSFVEVCSTLALTTVDSDNLTPLHRAMTMKDEPASWCPPEPASLAAFAKQTTQSTAPIWKTKFVVGDIFDVVLKRSEREGGSNLMAEILTKVSHKGESPLQARLALAEASDDNKLANRMKTAIFEAVSSVSDVSLALYGTSENTKELYLNMADFNQAGLDFESFVDKLTDDPRRDDDVIAFENTLIFVHLPDLNYVKQPCPHSTIRKLFTWLKRRGVQTIKTLRIPDSTTTPLSDAFVQKYVFDLFRIESLDWRKLDINLGALAYSIGGTDAWTKNSTVTDLTLYSSGNWSVLYHWMSKDGLTELPKLRSVRIYIVQLDPAPGVYDQATHDRHTELINAYKKRMDDEFRNPPQQGEEPLPFLWDIRTNVSWDYPLPPHKLDDTSTQAIKHQFTSQLQPTFDALCVLEDKPEFDDFRDPYDDGEDENLDHLGSSRGGAYSDDDGRSSDRRVERYVDRRVERHADRRVDRYDDRDHDRYAYGDRYDDRYDRYDRYDDNYDDRYDNRSYSYGRGDGRRPRRDNGNGSSRWKLEQNRFLEYALGPIVAGGLSDKRIRVAILDNGADRVRSRFRDMIAKGQSYVTTNELHADQPLPWWMVSDPHGTQMASLVSQVNQYCRLYIARVGTLRHDIRADSAVHAIEWAIKHKVDVISISWTLRKPDEALQKAIAEAAKNRILIFCSTPDEGMNSKAWPVGYTDHVISVSATDQYGYLTAKTRTDEPADVLIPGENMRAAGPAYIGNVSSSVSGSSVATALAAGIASLALVLLRTFNDDTQLVQDTESTKERHSYYTKQGMLKVFERMASKDKDKAVQLSKMFPQDIRDGHAALEKLAEMWRVDGW